MRAIYIICVYLRMLAADSEPRIILCYVCQWRTLMMMVMMMVLAVGCWLLRLWYHFAYDTTENRRRDFALQPDIHNAKSCMHHNSAPLTSQCCRMMLIWLAFVIHTSCRTFRRKHAQQMVFVRRCLWDVWFVRAARVPPSDIYFAFSGSESMGR